MEQALLARPAVHSATAPDRSKPTDWYVLALFVALGANQVILWFTFSSVSTPGVLEYYGFTDSTIDLLLAWGPIGGILFQPAATALLSTSQSDGLGLRASMRVAGFLSLLCAALRLLPSLVRDVLRRRHAAATAAVLSLAQLLNAAAGPFLMSGCSTLAETYFPPHRRGTATALAYSGGNAGQLLAFVIGPAAIDDRAANVVRLLVLELLLSAAILGATLAFLPSPHHRSGAFPPSPLGQAGCNPYSPVAQGGSGIPAHAFSPHPSSGDSCPSPLRNAATTARPAIKQGGFRPPAHGLGRGGGCAVQGSGRAAPTSSTGGLRHAPCSSERPPAESDNISLAVGVDRIDSTAAGGNACGATCAEASTAAASGASARSILGHGGPGRSILGHGGPGRSILGHGGPGRSVAAGDRAPDGWRVLCLRALRTHGRGLVADVTAACGSRPMLLLAFLAGVEAGVSAGWAGLIPQTLAPPLYSSRLAGFAGVANSAACLLGNIAGGLLADTRFFSGRLPQLLVLVFLLSALAFGGYAACAASVLSGAPLLPVAGGVTALGMATAAGLFQGCADPVLYELAAEVLRLEAGGGVGVVPADGLRLEGSGGLGGEAGLRVAVLRLQAGGGVRDTAGGPLETTRHAPAPSQDSRVGVAGCPGLPVEATRHRVSSGSTGRQASHGLATRLACTEDVPQGAREDVPQGAPEDVPQGAPEDVPQGAPQGGVGHSEGERRPAYAAPSQARVVGAADGGSGGCQAGHRWAATGIQPSTVAVDPECETGRPAIGPGALQRAPSPRTPAAAAALGTASPHRPPVPSANPLHAPAAAPVSAGFVTFMYNAAALALLALAPVLQGAASVNAATALIFAGCAVGVAAGVRTPSRRGGHARQAHELYD